MSATRTIRETVEIERLPGLKFKCEYEFYRKEPEVGLPDRIKIKSLYCEWIGRTIRTIDDASFLLQCDDIRDEIEENLLQQILDL